MKTFQNIDLSDSFLIEILVYFRLLLQSFFTYSVTLSTYCLGWKTFMKLDLVHAHLSKRLYTLQVYTVCNSSWSNVEKWKHLLIWRLLPKFLFLVNRDVKVFFLFSLTMLVYLLRYLNVVFRLGNYYKLSTFFLFWQPAILT